MKRRESGRQKKGDRRREAQPRHHKAHIWTTRDTRRSAQRREKTRKWLSRLRRTATSTSCIVITFIRTTVSIWTGAFKKNDVWQVRWQILVIPTGSRYRAPQGAVGWRFMKCLAEEFRRAREQIWIADCFMVFMGVILQTALVEHKAQNFYFRITRRLYLWEIGKYGALCSDTAEESRYWPTQTTQNNEETEYRTLNLDIVNGKTRADIRGIRGQGKSRVLFTRDVDNKTG